MNLGPVVKNFKMQLFYHLSYITRCALFPMGRRLKVLNNKIEYDKHNESFYDKMGKFIFNQQITYGYEANHNTISFM